MNHPTSSHPEAVLHLTGLRHPVHLGVTPAERSSPQSVRFDVILRFPKLPPGALSDSIDGTVCYADLTTAIRHVCDGREFRLIEKLAMDIYEELQKKTLHHAFKLAVRVTKERPPIHDLECASFELKDWETGPQW